MRGMTTVPGPSVAALLARWPLYQLFVPEELAKLAATGDSLRVDLGERLFRRGELGRYLYVVRRGRARFSRGGPSGRRVTLATAGPGDLLGDEVLVPPDTYAATCSAAEPMLLHRLPRERILDWVCQRPEIDFRLPGLLCLHRLLQRVGDEAFLGLRGPEEFHDLMGVLRLRCFPAGTRLAAAGVRGDNWFSVLEGSVSQPRSLGVDALLGLASRGDQFATTEVRALCLTAAEFERLYPAPAMQSIMLSLGPALSFVGQRGAVDCGAAALTMAARRLGLRFPIEDVHKQLALGIRGANLDSLARAATALGLRA